MLDRLVENWLTKVNERSIEIPFCQLLTSEGYQVVHLSRHGPAEQGKDILAIDPNGTPCAFQLKGSFGGKITQKAWEGILPQIQRLVELPIKHPSINPKTPMRAFLVTTGELDEEVRQEIFDRNKVWKERKYPQLETIVKGQLLQRFAKMHSDFWPTNLSNEKALLEFFLSDGRSYIKKKELCDFLTKVLSPNINEKGKAETKRILSSAAVINAYALSSFDLQENHVAILEGWMVFLATILSYIERFNLSKEQWNDIVNLSIVAIEIAATKLVRELKDREYLTEGDPFTDPLFYKGRVTLLCSLVAWHALWNKFTDDTDELDEWTLGFIKKHKRDLQLWGEAAIPQFLSIYWFLVTDKTTSPDRILVDLITSICNANEKINGLPDPYHGLPEVISWGFDLPSALLRQPENFKGQSYSLEGLIHLLTRRGWRGILQELWKPITGINFTEFIPSSSWQFSLWHTDEGKTNTKLPETPQSWAKLSREANESNKAYIPELLAQNPMLLLLFSIIYPQRFTKDVMKLIDGSVTRKK